ncbi:MAG: electron transport complex subunit E [Granulosicoccus sp.]
MTDTTSTLDSKVDAQTPTDSEVRQLWKQGLWNDNPALVKLLGLCPLLAVSNTATNALALGIATTLTLLITNVSVSILRAHLIHAIRLPVYVLIIASSVTSIELMMQAWLPALHASLGIFLPLIVTNCLIIGRAEAFASRQGCHIATIDALAMGIGFTWVLVCLGALREVIGQGTLFNDAQLLLGDFGTNWALRLLATEHTVLIALLPPGAFLILGLLLALKNAIDQSR